MDFSAVINLDSETIAHELSDQLTNEELLEFVASLDLIVADWNFTEALYKFFKKEHKTYKAEVKEYDC